MIQTEVSGNGAPIFSSWQTKYPEFNNGLNQQGIDNLRSVFQAKQVQDEKSAQQTATLMTGMKLDGLQPDIAQKLAGEWQQFADKWTKNYKANNNTLTPQMEAEKDADQQLLMNKALWVQELQKDAIQTMPNALKLKANYMLTEDSWSSLKNWWTDLAGAKDLGKVPLMSSLVQQRQPFSAEKLYRGLADAQNGQTAFNIPKAATTYLAENSTDKRNGDRQALIDMYGVSPTAIDTDDKLANYMATGGQLEWRKGNSHYQKYNGPWGIDRAQTMVPPMDNGDGSTTWMFSQGIPVHDGDKGMFTGVKKDNTTGQYWARVAIPKLNKDEFSAWMNANGGKPDKLHNDIAWFPMSDEWSFLLQGKNWGLTNYYAKDPGGSYNPPRPESPPAVAHASSIDFMPDPKSDVNKAKSFNIDSPDAYKKARTIPMNDRPKGLVDAMTQYVINHPEIKKDVGGVKGPRTLNFDDVLPTDLKDGESVNIKQKDGKIIPATWDAAKHKFKAKK